MSMHQASLCLSEVSFRYVFDVKSLEHCLMHICHNFRAWLLIKQLFGVKSEMQVIWSKVQYQGYVGYSRFILSIMLIKHDSFRKS